MSPQTKFLDPPLHIDIQILTEKNTCCHHCALQITARHLRESIPYYCSLESKIFYLLLMCIKVCLIDRINDVIFVAFNVETSGQLAIVMLIQEF